MTFASFDLASDQKAYRKEHKKWPWYGAPIFCAIWFTIFYVAVIPSFFSYPKMLYMRDEANHPDEFIGERAMHLLGEYSAIGNKMVGSENNEVHTVNFIKREVEKIVEQSRTDIYDFEWEVQYASGAFYLWNVATSYANVSNIVVRISRKDSPNDNYLLVNSHYDSEVKTPGAGDDGVMAVIMLETLRVISLSDRPLDHPVVFLFNGAEEANMLGSHGFITTHRWAKNCKALINLDSTGAGGREVLFQTGPNHPWLMNYYQKHAPHPFSVTLAEELFQNNFIPSDTDFRIFRDFGNVPGLDMAHALNGYVYHTKFDNFKNLAPGTYQSTGENVLALTWALANAPELDDTAAHEEGHAVFFDYLGWFMVVYTEAASIAINTVVSVVALIAICISIYFMTKQNDSDAPKAIVLRFCVIFLVQLGAVIIAWGLTLIVAVFMHAVGLSESWYYGIWMTFGLYFSTFFFGLGLLPAFYIQWTKHKTNMKLNDTIACFMHAHCILIVLVCVILMCMGVRSAFFPMFGLFFYTISVLLQLIFKLIFKKRFFMSVHLLCQLAPFLFYTFLNYEFLLVFVPMQGRDGPDSKPDMLLALFIALMTMHFAGFIIPILFKFRKSKIFISMFGVITIIFIILAATPAGFPFKADVATQRYYVLHTERVLHNEDSTTTRESGFYIQPVDTRYSELYDTTLKDVEPESWLTNNCASEPYCGLPLYSGRWLDWKDSARWIHNTAPVFPVTTELTEVSRQSINATRKRYEYNIVTGDRIVIFIDPKPNVRITNWSVDDTVLLDGRSPPYFIYHVFSMVTTPFNFWLEFEHDAENTDGPYFKMSVSVHFLYHPEYYTSDFKDFLDTFPDWSYTTDWLASYESWVF
ncbi:endoplasmic reticulum metallopeptidase 1-like [Drosophila sulfurigaster albostrigata]|uniref:endoplasmic reticulum metallopeptidase 1-like n=1 Tax=Drosophila sulfurigaster albostrigata TaxID=89887 RepID=UPI002D218AB6|nr:endoplasmic reticulum metallopeptidase 1-like [Drosophila sulfurigaster albostrigata]